MLALRPHEAAEWQQRLGAPGTNCTLPHSGCHLNDQSCMLGLQSACWALDAVQDAPPTEMNGALPRPGVTKSQVKPRNVFPVC